MGEFDRNTTDPSLAEQHHSLFLRRLRVGFWVIVAASALTTIEDFRTYRDAFAVLLAIKLGLIATASLLMVASIRIPALRARPVLIGLLGVSVVCLATAVLGIIRGDVATTSLVLVVAGLATAAVLPWGLRAQLAAVAIAAAAMAGSSYAVLGHLATPMGDGWTGALIAGAVVLFVTHQFARYRDTIEQRTNELRRSEAHFRSLIENASDLITVINAEGLMTYDSPAHERVLGYTRAERVGTNPLALVHPDDAERVLETFARGIAVPGRSEHLEYRYRHRDGSWRHMEAVGTNLLHDPAVAGVVVNSRDVTERKQMESELRSSEEYLKVLFEYAPDAIYLNDLEGRFVDGNRAAQEMIGYAHDEMVGQSFLTLGLLPPDQLQSAAQLLVASGVGPTGPVELRVNHRDGSPIPMDVRTHPIHLKGQTLVLGVARDARARKRVEAQLQQSKEEAEAANRAKSAFLANMSHEIRTPMNGIIGMTELTLAGPLSAEQREYLGMVRSSADSLLGIINDILDFSKVEAGKLELDARDFELRASLDETLKCLNLRAAAKGLELVSRIAPDVPQVLVGDAGRLRQVLVNLVGNAIKFTAQGRVVVAVRTESRCGDATTLHFAVTDTGIGIAAAQQQRIFHQFEQADGSTSRRYGGTGLGLAICGRLVPLMGGSIWVESALGAGSTLHFTARFGVSALAAAVRPPRGAPPAAIVDAPLRPLRILLAEDNAVNQMLARRILERRGHRVLLAGNGAEALAVLRDEAVDVVLMDVQMPEMDGFEATAAIRAQERGGAAHMPIIAMTAHALKGDEEHCRAAGMDGYVSKPISAQRLFDELDRIVADVPAQPGVAA